MRAEFYTNEGKPFMVQGKHATITIVEPPPDYLYIPTAPKRTLSDLGTRPQITLNKFARLAVSTDGQVALYALEKVREWERGIV